ncbi:MAG: S-layer homology domain-containing protein [Oscillospiraceae bacterium]|jgi:hypothetical protein|nr:S-layer homology domain-containing protein [Oscillospiraceae bacterium]
MLSHKKRFFCLLLAVCLALALPLTALATETSARASSALAADDAYEETLANALAYIFSRVPEPTFGMEWSVLALARAEYPAPGYYSGYFDKIVAHVRQNGNAQLDRSRVTENARLILALSALGLEATDVGGHNLLTPMADLSFITRQGINGPVFTLLALDTKAYEIPADDSAADPATRGKMIDYILNREIQKGTKEAGGFALSGSVPDPDMTGMVLQTLSPYRDQPPVAAAIDRALAALSDMQEDDGGFSSWGAVNVESISQVIVALTALDIDPTADPRFIKRNGDPVTALLRFAVGSGGFRHTQTGEVSDMATDQGTYALTAYDRFRKGKNSLYDMRDAFGPSGPPPTGDAAAPETPAAGTGSEDVLPFDDVTAADWFYEAVNYMQSTDLMRGTGAAKFAPNAALTRAMFVTILHRCEHEPAAAGAAAFPDVTDGQWYTTAVAWAGASGLVSGYGDGRFGPDDNVTREQVAVILYHYAAWKALDTSAATDLADCADVGSVSDWALPAVRWAAAEGLLTGRAAGILAPKNTATRAEVAALLMRFLTLSA